MRRNPLFEQRLLVISVQRRCFHMPSGSEKNPSADPCDFLKTQFLYAPLCHRPGGVWRTNSSTFFAKLDHRFCLSKSHQFSHSFLWLSPIFLPECFLLILCPHFQT